MSVELHCVDSVTVWQLSSHYVQITRKRHDCA